jgi:hypothetical protein
MSNGNTFKLKTESRRSKGLFALIAEYFNVDGLFADGVPLSIVPKALFIALLLLVYVYNSHQGDRMARQITVLSSEVEDLRTDFTTLQSEWMIQTRRSQLIDRAKSMGLIESQEPPFKIIAEKE